MDQEILEYGKLDDTDLVGYFCGDPPDQEAFAELWKRYESKIKGFAGVLTWMCPDSYSREIFHEDVFSETQEKVLNQICAYKRQIPFSAWLWMLAQGAAIDKRRQITGRGPVLRTFHALTEEELARSGALFRDKVKKDRDRTILTSERMVIMKQVFDRYRETQEGFESLSVVTLRFREQLTKSDIAKRLCTYDRKISEMLVHDCEALQTLFAEAGIQNLRDIWTDSET
jgi:DNA-directed RNA polymerase specialized sigma24 family protein